MSPKASTALASPALLAGGGVSGDLLRSRDWAGTPLGAIDAWPGALKTIVRAMLGTHQPTCLFWGPELLNLYNDGFIPLLGEKHPTAMGQRAEVCWSDAWPVVGPLLADVIAQGKAVLFAEMLVPIVREGRLRDAWWNYSYSPAFDDEGAVAGVLVVATETTAAVETRRSLERALADSAEARRKSELASLAKDEFLATASHELRTPLNAILGWARMLLGGQLDQSARQRAVETIERNARAQVGLVEDILDGSRIITGKLQLEVRPLDMTALVAAAVDAIRPAADAKNIAVSMHLAPEAARIVGDPDRLQQVVWNLVNNAVKFTPRGGSVEVRLERVGTHVGLTVTDSGQGIRPEFLPHVFERFRQAEGTTTRRFGGLGLGLAIVRHLVEAHGGTVEVASEGEGRGARFVVLLPVQAVFPEHPPEPSRDLGPGVPTAVTGARLTGVSVLVVDDEADARDLVATVLRASGAHVVTVATAAQAMEHLAREVPMLLVSDIGMPEVDGYQLMRRVRSSAGEAAAIPAIALTAYSREQDRRLALAAGFQTHVTKPVDPSDLVQVAAGLLQFVARQASPEAREDALQRADTFLKLQKILSTQSIHEALHFLNSRTPHRFTGIYRFDPPMLRNVALVDSYAPGVERGDDSPLSETYCSIVGDTQRGFTTEDARRDDRLRTHPARDSVVSYCGVLLRDEAGQPFGTLCHFDLLPCDVPVAEIALMEAAAPLLMSAIPKGPVHD
ncbi:MAG TPA: ATP-binding protein [Polyangiaceae bacterium]|jgi:signal transduction histidine kinase/DNA-binding NarL/FixJ family response regulator